MKGSRRGRRGAMVVEVTVAAVVLMATMGVSIKVLGWVGVERRAADRRQWAVQEASNVLERLGGQPFSGITGERAKALAAKSSAAELLPEAKWDVAVEDEATKGMAAKRVSVRLRWKERSGEWGAPVRLTTWFYRAGGAS